MAVVRLIPGLPDDLSRECLIRVAYSHHPAVRRVCELWMAELDSPDFHQLRRFQRLSRHVIAVAQVDPALHLAGAAKKYSASAAPFFRLSIHDPATGEWGTLPPVPGLDRGLPLFCQVAGVERDLVVVGGWDPETWIASDQVYIYSFGSGEWRRGASLPGPRRSFFACAVVGRTLLVAGGHDEDKNALRSALAYDVAGDWWDSLPDMAAERDECRGVVVGGRFHVIGGYPTEAQGRFCGSAEAFDLDTWRWGPVVEDVLEAGTCPRTCAAGPDGRLFRIAACGTVAVLDGNTWQAVAELPEDARVALQVVGLPEELVVMGSGSHGGAQVGYALNVKLLKWKKVKIPREYSGHVHGVCCLEL